jgi:hypothetical protein
MDTPGANMRGHIWIGKFCVNKVMRDAVTKHVKNNQTHALAVMALTMKKTGEDMEGHTMRANDKVVKAMKKRFRSMYWLCKEMIAIDKYNSLVELEVVNGAYDDTGTGPTHNARPFAHDSRYMFVL